MGTEVTVQSEQGVPCEKKACDVPINQWFFGTIGGHEHGLFMRSYDVIVFVEKPGIEWKTHEDSGPMILDYRPVKRVTVTVEE